MTTFSSPRVRPQAAPLLSRQGFRAPALMALALPATLLLSVLVALPAQAHHVMALLHLKPTPVTGLISGLAHPLLGPDHLLFLLALALVGLRHRRRWMLALLATGLAGTCLGLLLPGLPASEALVAFTLVAEGLVLLGRWPVALLVPAFALHGYALSTSVLGWTTAPVAFYLLGLLLSQGSLLLLTLTALRRIAAPLTAQVRLALAAALIGIGAAWTWSALVA
ncbi:MAG: HupE/UreJ family protein [Synechococcus sp. ELA057]